MRIVPLSVALVWLALVPSPLAGDPQDPTPAEQAELSIDSLLAKMHETWPARKLMPPTSAFGLDADCATLRDELTRNGCWKAYQGLFAYYDFGFGHRRTVFWWTHWSSRIIFVVVLGLVCAGMYFAWLQFRQDLRLPPRSDSESKPGPLHHVEIGRAGIKVSSPVLGVVILVISLAFFYLYLVYVYPITEIL